MQATATHGPLGHVRAIGVPGPDHCDVWKAEERPRELQGTQERRGDPFPLRCYLVEPLSRPTGDGLRRDDSHMRRSLIMKATAAGHAATTLADASTAQAATDDPFYGKLWGLQQIHAEQAWAQTTAVGSVVAAVDTGTTPWPIWRVRFCQGRWRLPRP